MAKELAVGDKVDVKKNNDVPLAFTGTVEKIYTNSALVTIDDFDKEDAVTVEDLKHRTVINFKNLRVDGQEVVAPVIEEEENTNKKKPADKKAEPAKKAETDPKADKEADKKQDKK
ncbi:DUF2187 family protein [Lacticaseibacillus zhaodongensis]|uniref:DUF2187 family protein n=1 Tax=Lacticaseibacillus zhaodongensis TaxID=2668065 RepID=UPI0012D2D40F|nr:DUF2187 family protein [Lacticaseibacillus zhaodongensis]